MEAEARPHASLEARLGHVFDRPALLESALRHGSRAYEEGDASRDNERLEFLGDAVLNLIVSEHLMNQWPEASEGVLSRARAQVVNTRVLAECAREVGLGEQLRLGRGEEASGGRAKRSILADGFEAVLGALYLDGGLDPVRRFLSRALGERLAHPELARGDAKTRLQEWLQKRGQSTPTYRTIAERGPDHAREFEVEIWAGDRALARGSGRSKRAAEQVAAREALERLEREAAGARPEGA